MNDTRKKIEQLAEEYAEKYFSGYFRDGQKPTSDQIADCEIGKGYSKHSFIAGYTAALSESKQMKWTKCSERLPEKRRIVILGLIDRNGMTLHGDGYIDEFHGKDQWFLGDHRHDFPVKLTHDVIEWLDESAPQPNQQGCEQFAIGFAEWIWDERYVQYWGSDEPNNLKWYKSYTLPDRKYFTTDQLLQLYTSPSPQKTQTK